MGDQQPMDELSEAGDGLDADEEERGEGEGKAHRPCQPVPAERSEGIAEGEQREEAGHEQSAQDGAERVGAVDPGDGDAESGSEGDGEAGDGAQCQSELAVEHGWLVGGMEGEGEEMRMAEEEVGKESSDPCGGDVEHAGPGEVAGAGFEPGREDGGDDGEQEQHWMPVNKEGLTQSAIEEGRGPAPGLKVTATLAGVAEEIWSGPEHGEKGADQLSRSGSNRGARTPSAGSAARARRISMDSNTRTSPR